MTRPYCYFDPVHGNIKQFSTLELAELSAKRFIGKPGLYKEIVDIVHIYKIEYVKEVHAE